MLPSEPVPAGLGRLVTLPPPSTRLPREKPVPKPREPTTWEKFAKLKGIHKRKKEKIAYDEQSGQWKRTFGYKRANDKMAVWAMPAKEGEDDGLDPWTRAQREKRERVDKNKKKQVRNLERASGDRVPGTLDLAAATGKRSKGKKRKVARHAEVAVEIAQKSTASMGKFDKLNKYEPDIKKKSKPRRDAEFQKSFSAEKSSVLKAMEKVVGKGGGGKVDVNKAVNLAQQEEELRRKAKKGRAGKKRRSKQ